MDQIRLHVGALRGHYGFPGRNGIFSVRQTAQVPHVSQIPGFLESACGDELGSFKGRYAYGRVCAPLMQGRLLRKDKVFHGANPDPLGRPCYWEALFGVEYQVVVEGTYVERLRAALRGELPRYGVLSLGTSEDEVWLLKEADKAAEWVTPGKAFPLIVKPQRGYKNRRPQYGFFDLTEFREDIPIEAWFERS